MPIRRKTPRGAERAYYEERVRRWYQAAVNTLVYVGERVLAIARNGHKYVDRTGNLTSSIGYAVVDNGRVVKQSAFAAVKGGSQGSNEGMAFLQRLITEHSSGLVFIMVAGMEYAAYVEAMSLDVLDSSEQVAQTLIPQILKQLKL